jgi:transposase
VTKERRRITREFKLMALSRMETCGDVKALAKELGVRRELLYDWREKFAVGGAEALQPAGRPKPKAPSALSAEKQIGELERQLGRKQLEIDFLERALRRIEASRRPNDGPGATASSRRSKR